jgi:exopolysaccharide biosynthesis polyprenyl glycosylphosphotransferase
VNPATLLAGHSMILPPPKAVTLGLLDCWSSVGFGIDDECDARDCFEGSGHRRLRNVAAADVDDRSFDRDREQLGRRFVKGTCRVRLPKDDCLGAVRIPGQFAAQGRRDRPQLCQRSGGARKAGDRTAFSAVGQGRAPAVGLCGRTRPLLPDSRRPIPDPLSHIHGPNLQSAGITKQKVAPVRLSGENGAMQESGSKSDSQQFSAVSQYAARRKTFGRVRRLKVVGDLIAILLSALLLDLVVLPLFNRSLAIEPVMLVFLVMLPVWVLIAFWFGLYHDFERRLDRSIVHQVGRIAVAAALWSWLFILLRAAVTSGINEVLPMALLWVLMVPALLIVRSMVRLIARRAEWDRQRVALIGDEAGIARVTERIERHPEWGIDLVLVIPVGPVSGDEHAGGTGSGTFVRDEAVSLLEAEEVGRLVIAGGHSDFATLDDRTRLVQEAVERGISVDIVTGGPESLYSRALNQDMEGLPLVSVAPSAPRPLELAIKRVFDVFASAIVLVLFAPVLLWAAVRVRLDSPGPVIYRALRVGRGDREFRALKFRTMVEDADEMRPALREKLDAEGGDVLFKIEEDPRITRAGRTLRVWSIDELPQLFNVLKGEMSMVGPRPLPPEEAARAEALFVVRTRMRPGLAGPWQALGRSSIPFEDMIRLDYAYVTGWTMTEDLRLLVRTLSAVVKRRGSM